jgi:hypothetical protein
MAPIAIGTETQDIQSRNDDIAALKERLQSLKVEKDITLPPDNTLRRYQKAGIDLSNGYPYFPPKPDFVQDVHKIRTDLREYVDPGTRADPEKKALFGAAKEVKNLTTHIGVSPSESYGESVLITVRDYRLAAQGPHGPTERRARAARG